MWYSGHNKPEKEKKTIALFSVFCTFFSFLSTDPSRPPYITVDVTLDFNIFATEMNHHLYIFDWSDFCPYKPGSTQVDVHSSWELNGPWLTNAAVAHWAQCLVIVRLYVIIKLTMSSSQIHSLHLESRVVENWYCMMFIGGDQVNCWAVDCVFTFTFFSLLPFCSQISLTVWS